MEGKTMHQRDDKRIGRRELFRLAGVGGLAGTAAMAGTTRKATAKTDDAAKSGAYRETEHVKTYYALAKF